MGPWQSGTVPTGRSRSALLATLLVAVCALAWPTAPQAGATPSGRTDVLASGLVYTPLPYTCRIVDTRTGFGPVGAGQRTNTYHAGLTTDCDVPGDGTVRAVMVNVIAVGATGTGYIRAAAYPYAQNTASRCSTSTTAWWPPTPCR